MDVFIDLSNQGHILLGKLPVSGIDCVSLQMTGESEISDFFKILGKADVQVLPTEYQNLCSSLNVKGAAALHVIPRQKLSEHLDSELKRLQDALCVIEDQEYLVTYLTIKRFLLGLHRVLVDQNRLRDMINSAPHEATKRSLSSLLHEKDGFCRAVEYSMTNSATGRLTVTKGPQILTIPSESRACLKSRYPRGKVLQIDIISAEPKFALHLSGKRPPKDVYQHISETILENKVTRAQAKLITLCSLYGQSIKKLDEQLPDSVGARGVIQKTKQYFDSDFLLSRLKSEKTMGKIRNAIGRPIVVPEESPHLLISYYLQSSVAEGSLLMFSDFIQKTNLVCTPMFVIHDALILDCDETSSKQLLDDEQFSLFLGDWKFDAEVKIVGT